MVFKSKITYKYLCQSSVCWPPYFKLQILIVIVTLWLCSFLILAMLAFFWRGGEGCWLEIGILQVFRHIILFCRELLKPSVDYLLGHAFPSGNFPSSMVINQSIYMYDSYGTMTFFNKRNQTPFFDNLIYGLDLSRFKEKVFHFWFAAIFISSFLLLLKTYRTNFMNSIWLKIQIIYYIGGTYLFSSSRQTLLIRAMKMINWCIGAMEPQVRKESIQLLSDDFRL